MKARGNRSDNLDIFCEKRLNINNSVSYWTNSFSEENGGTMRCNPGHAVTGLACDGGHCDNMKLKCTEISGHGSNSGEIESDRWLTDDENINRNLTRAIDIPTGLYLFGIKYRGNDCDDMKLIYRRYH
jgi:hypothetical protein